MLDFLMRALRNPIDYIGCLSLRRLTLDRIEQQSETINSYVFHSKKALSWKPGQHGVFWFIDVALKGKNWRAFSIASSCHENPHELRIATTIPEPHSPFKERLSNLKPGDTIFMQGPIGELHPEEKMRQIVGIAGGIGITPFRTILFEIANGYITDTNIVLIFSAHNNEYTFKDQLEQFAQSPHIDIIYTETPDEVNAQLQQQINKYRNNAYYFISGSPGMIKALESSCDKQGVCNIVSDPFKGY